MDPPLCSACSTCSTCPRSHRTQRDRRRMYDFLMCLRPEFEPVRAQLVSRSPPPTTVEVFTALCSLSEQLSVAVLAAPIAAPTLAFTPVTSAATSPSSSASTAAPTPAYTPKDTKCTRYNRWGHSHEKCRAWLKNRQARGGGPSRGVLKEAGPQATLPKGAAHYHRVRLLSLSPFFSASLTSPRRDLLASLSLLQVFGS
uniref:Uncharacterized protein n=1 Tax=Arundo donax TaxID=35708 RepID=A0A0A9H4X0_ARUDO